eukprot:CAMPEP_0182423660 /NCGR_PEP_ID=MMETSP1167-20130531/9735_1 /TAXON_ID=2988 /ORGANISM="Mallomonas Sp, Strain CCMP3275" /LENGTH=145 /DNA_ID=CAMNT_0024602841 /DNA_START=592 /DNA_END=1026 /DNA_ORIENTATION=+
MSKVGNIDNDGINLGSHKNTRTINAIENATTEDFISPLVSSSKLFHFANKGFESELLDDETSLLLEGSFEHISVGGMSGGDPPPELSLKGDEPLRGIGERVPQKMKQSHNKFDSKIITTERSNSKTALIQEIRYSSEMSIQIIGE